MFQLDHPQQLATRPFFRSRQVLVSGHMKCVLTEMLSWSMTYTNVRLSSKEFSPLLCHSHVHSVFLQVVCQVFSRGHASRLSYFIVQYAEKIRERVTSASETPHLLSIFATTISLPLVLFPVQLCRTHKTVLKY